MNGFEVKEANKSEAEILRDMMISLRKHEEKANDYTWKITGRGEDLLMDEIEKMIEKHNCRIFVSKSSEEVLGFISGEVKEQKKYKPHFYGFISSLFVKKEYRRKGIAKALLQKLLKFFKSEGIEEITLRYIVGNHEGESFWKDLEFKEVVTTASRGKLDDLLD